MAGTDSFVQVPPDSTGKLVDCDSLTTGSGTVQRERHRVAGAAAAELADVRNANAGATDYGLVTREAPKSWKLFNVLLTASGDGTIVAAVVGKRLKVYWFLVQNQDGSNSVNVIWKSATNVLLGPVFLQSVSSWREADPPPSFAVATNAGEALVLNLDAARNVRVVGAYWDDDAS